MLPPNRFKCGGLSGVFKTCYYLTVLWGWSPESSERSWAPRELRRGQSSAISDTLCSVTGPHSTKSNLLKFSTCTCFGCVVRKEGKRVSVHIVQSYTNPLGCKPTALLQSVRKASPTDGSPTASDPNLIGDLFLWLAGLRKTTRRASMGIGKSERVCVKEAASA